MRASTTLTFGEALTIRDIKILTKSGITGMVVVSTAIGMLAAAESALPLALWVSALVGTAFVSAGASALNQVVERDVDAVMRRTAGRPIPAGRIHPDVALSIGVGCAVVGLIVLAGLVNPATAVLAAATLAGYVFVYTPLKRVHNLATIVGAVPGALPPVIGWVAVRGTVDAGAWVLFAILFFWQMPHFLAIAWLYRDDYARGGFPLLSTNDPTGARTSRQALLYTAALVPVSLLLCAVHVAGAVYFAGALVLGAVFLVAAGSFVLDRSTRTARRLMLVSVFYLPAVWAVLVVDRFL